MRLEDYKGGAMSKYKYWSTDKLLTLLKELELSVSGSHIKDIHLKYWIEDILCRRGQYL